MATILTKKIIRESTEKIEDKEIMVTLTHDQAIELKLKGKRGNGQAIYIKDLYEQLYGLKSGDKKGPDGPLSITSDNPRKRGDKKMISLYDLRSHNAISTMGVATVAKFDQIIKSVIDSYK